MNKPSSYDIVIVGGGIVGLTAALLFAQNTTLSIAIIESKPLSSPLAMTVYHHRVSALSLSSIDIFKSLGVWKAMQVSRVSPFKEIKVWDEARNGEIHFHCQDIAELALGYIVENNVMQFALQQQVATCPNIRYLAPISLQSLEQQEDAILLHSQTAGMVRATLVIGADGAESWLRQQAHIQLDRHAYQQQAIVATVQTAKPHQQIASQVFLQTGPLAFLPLKDENFSSIVWSVPHHEAAHLMSLSSSQFNEALGKAFTYRLGEVIAGDRYVFPLYKQHVKHYIAPRIALIGDAAHTVHPLAGQGVNMGLQDALNLATLIQTAHQQGRAFATPTLLRQYERARKAENLPMLLAVDMVKQLFASDKLAIQGVRSWGLSMTDKIKWLKNLFVRHAVYGS